LTRSRFPEFEHGAVHWSGLAWLPAFVLALAKWQTVGWFVLIAAGLTGIHVFALNLIAPQIVGRKVRLNAVAITIALLFWGWVWGGWAGAGDSDYGRRCE